VPPSVAISYTSESAALTWSGNGSFYNVYRSTNSGSAYTLIATYVTNSAYIDNALLDGRAYYYVVTALNILGAESAYSTQVTAYPASTAPVAMGVQAVYNSGQNGFQITWPGDHSGWRLLMDTNGLANPNWVPVPNSAATNQVWIPISADQNVFFELVYP
jgi:hypothetical protein